LKEVAVEGVFGSGLPLLVQFELGFAGLPVRGEVDGAVGSEGVVEYDHSNSNY